jgi:hypothetical protein
MIMPWSRCFSSRCVWCVIARRRVVYSCVCVEVKKAASSSDAWQKKKEKES